LIVAFLADYKLNVKELNKRATRLPQNHVPMADKVYCCDGRTFSW